MQEGDICVLPEGCISIILSLTSPQDACTCSFVSTTFKSAADSDVVWEKFLPADYKDIAARSVPLLDLNRFGSKKELYRRLCDEPLLIHGGSKTLSLERKSGKKCLMIGARELDIVLAENPQFWKWIYHNKSRFSEVARLLRVCCLYLTGTVDTRILSPKTTYTVYLVIQVTSAAYGLGHSPVQVSVDYVEGGGRASGSCSVYLGREPESYQRHRYVSVHCRRRRYGSLIRLPEVRKMFPRKRGDGWMELEMGEFYNDDGQGGRVEMRLNGTQGSHWKSGVIFQGIEVRPKWNQ